MILCASNFDFPVTNGGGTVKVGHQSTGAGLQKLVRKLVLGCCMVFMGRGAQDYQLCRQVETLANG